MPPANIFQSTAKWRVKSTKESLMDNIKSFVFVKPKFLSMSLTVKLHYKWQGYLRFSLKHLTWWNHLSSPLWYKRLIQKICFEFFGLTFDQSVLLTNMCVSKFQSGIRSYCRQVCSHTWRDEIAVFKRFISLQKT